MGKNDVDRLQTVMLGCGDMVEDGGEMTSLLLASAYLGGYFVLYKRWTDHVLCVL